MIPISYRFPVRQEICDPSRIKTIRAAQKNRQTRRIKGEIIMLKKVMTRDVMLDALEQDYDGLMNLGDIYGARGVEAAIDTIHLYERALELACEEIHKARKKKFTDTKDVPEIVQEYINYAKTTDYGADSEH